VSASAARKRVSSYREAREPPVVMAASVPAAGSTSVGASGAHVEQLAEAHQVGMAHVGERAELRLEAQEVARIDARQRLERDVGAVLAVERLVDDPHAAGAQPRGDLEPLGP